MLQVQPIRAFSDNYVWLLTDGSGAAVAVDPGDADPVLEALSASRLALTAVLITHHHQDHTGGLDDLAVAFPALRTYGPADRRIPAVTDPVREGTRLRPAGLDAEFVVLETPGHTSTHIAFLGDGRLFCGDTLFAGGCGRVFDGTFEQLAHSLDRIAALPRDTLCYCAHEYTLSNLGFGRWVEPENAALAARALSDQRRLDAGEPTVPSRLDLELATNPFLRTREPQVIAAAERHAGQTLRSSAQVFTALRRWKDRDYD